MTAAPQFRWQAVGRRKTSVARVYLTPGTGKWDINGRNLGADRDRIAEACERGGSTMFGTGISPGFAELLAGDVTFFFHFAGIGASHAAQAELLLGEPKRFEHEEIRVAVITAVWT